MSKNEIKTTLRLDGESDDLIKQIMKEKNSKSRNDAIIYCVKAVGKYHKEEIKILNENIYQLKQKIIKTGSECEMFRKKYIGLSTLLIEKSRIENELIKKLKEITN